MDAQLALPGFSPAPRRTERFYFALLPGPAEQPHLIARGRESLGGGGQQYRPTAGHRLHVSLGHLGDHVTVPERYLGRAVQAASRIEFSEFAVCFDQAMVFSGRLLGQGQFPLVLCAGEGANQIRGLATALAQVLWEAGLPASFRSMLPHVTLGYTRARMAPRRVEATTWRVREFSLLHVRPGLEARHRVVSRWRLACRESSIV